MGYQWLNFVGHRIINLIFGSENGVQTSAVGAFFWAENDDEPMDGIGCSVPLNMVLC